MNNQFDEFTRSLAQSVTRRGALKKFGAGLAGIVFACFGLANKAEAAKGGCIPTGRACGPVGIGRPGSPKSCSNCCSGRYLCPSLSCYCL